MEFKAITAGDSGNSVTKFLPSSQHLAKSGSKGKLPKKSTPICRHISLAPPVVAGNISDRV